jgi:hypothetical protein
VDADEVHGPVGHFGLLKQGECSSAASCRVRD